MKKIFKLLSLLRLIKELRGHDRYGPRRYERSREYYPLYGRSRGSKLERLFQRYLSRRSF